MHINELERIIESAKMEMLDQHDHANDTDQFLAFLEKVAVKYANRKSSFSTLPDNDALNSYQKLIHTSLNEYDITNEKIKSLNSESSIFLEDKTSNKDLIEIGTLVNHFTEFQKQVNQELKRANSTIKKLKDEVKDLENTTNIDPLTLTHNRRGLQNYLDPILDTARENDKKLDMWLIMLDIDDFKIVNDTYGHIAGDKVLIFLSKVLRSIVRQEDHVFRFGGEEFIVILNRLSKYKALQITERILETVRQNKLIYKTDTINITLSIGLTSHQKNDNSENIIERSDKLLYEAKQGGKNKIVTEGDA